MIAFLICIAMLALFREIIPHVGWWAVLVVLAFMADQVMLGLFIRDRLAAAEEKRAATSAEPESADAAYAKWRRERNLSREQRGN